MILSISQRNPSSASSAIRQWQADRNAVTFVPLFELSLIHIYCKNDTANIILSYYAWLSETEGIHYICEADLPKRISCDEMDLSVLLGNALENAVEGCKKAKTERDLRIKLRYEKKKLILDVRNSFDGCLREKNGVLSVSYTHLDVYKRQRLWGAKA